PYIFKTADYGQSWTRIVNGIPDNAYVHAVREDPVRPGMLYAATQHGVYLSYDDGAHWQALNPNLPDVPVVDLIVERNQLVIATHGRSFWILDNLAPLRQMTPDLARTDALLFSPPAGIRSGGPLILSWWLEEKPESARLEILDASGEVVRTFEPDTTTADSTATAADSTATPADSTAMPVDSTAAAADSTDADDPADRYRSGPALPLQAGISHVGWDLRTDGFATFPGMILWGVRTTGPALPPGSYTARLTADDHTVTAPITIERNPLITGVTDTDLQAQYEFSRAVWAKVNEANRAVIAIRNVKAQLADRYEKSDDARLRSAGETLEASASEVEGNIYQVKNRSGQDPLNFPIKVNNRLANLLSMAERGDGPPGNNLPEIFRILSDELRGYTDRLQEVWATDLVAVNRELARLGLSAINPACEQGGRCPIL
ncbi:MAG: WD40/YVTN/BNR-like repeat-containing protein, partial [Candidatus Limnocylindria bacterium]